MGFQNTSHGSSSFGKVMSVERVPVYRLLLWQTDQRRTVRSTVLLLAESFAMWPPLKLKPLCGHYHYREAFKILYWQLLIRFNSPNILNVH